MTDKNMMNCSYANELFLGRQGSFSTDCCLPFATLRPQTIKMQPPSTSLSALPCQIELALRKRNLRAVNRGRCLFDIRQVRNGPAIKLSNRHLTQRQSDDKCIVLQLICTHTQSQPGLFTIEPNRYTQIQRSAKFALNDLVH